MTEANADIDITAELANMDDDFDQQEVSDNPNDTVPDGPYQVRVVKAELGRTQERNVPILKWQLRVLSGPHAKRLIFRHNLIESKENVKWLKQDLHTAGLDLTKLHELADRINELFGVTLDVKVTTKGQFTNVFLLRRIVVADAPEDGFGFGHNAAAGAGSPPPTNDALDAVF
jgi:hypothetical protein